LPSIPPRSVTAELLNFRRFRGIDNSLTRVDKFRLTIGSGAPADEAGVAGNALLLIVEARANRRIGENAAGW
jgi:hypothetical protein